jgi:hypothetical protein
LISKRFDIFVRFSRLISQTRAKRKAIKSIFERNSLNYASLNSRSSVFLILCCFLCFKCLNKKQKKEKRKTDKKLIVNWNLFRDYIGKWRGSRSGVCGHNMTIWQLSSNLVLFRWKIINFMKPTPMSPAKFSLNI